jgi:hypothetical protein
MSRFSVRIQRAVLLKQLLYVFLSAVFVLSASVILVAFGPTSQLPPNVRELVWSAANSAIFVTIVSTFVSAFAGTWGAQLLAERNARRRELLAEIRGTNAAIGMAFNIANTYITAKKQHIRELVDRYEQQCRDRQIHHDCLASETIPSGTPFSYQLELRTILAPFSPIEELQAVLRDRISPDGKAIVLLTPLVQSIRGFADTVSQRNVWIEDFKHLTAGDDILRAAYYFGTPFAQGRTDERYPSFMRVIGNQTDDCIAFSILIAESLKRYGDRLAKEFGRGTPKIAAPDFSGAGDLLPDMAHYAAWIAN